MLHLGNAGQLGLQSLLLLSEGKARRCVQLLEAPASLAVELQQVGVVLPGSGETRTESTSFDLMTDISLITACSSKFRDRSYHREGLCVMDSREMPAFLAAWKIFPSTSMLTALVHSSSRAYLGLTCKDLMRSCTMLDRTSTLLKHYHTTLVLENR